MSNRTGLPGPWLQPSEYGRNESGQFAMIPYEDVLPDRINALAAQFDARGYNYRVIHGFGKSRLEVQLAFPILGAEAPIDLWEYVGQKAQKDILACAVPTGITGRLSAGDISTIRNALNGVFPSKAPHVDPNDTSTAQYLDATVIGADGLTMYNLMKAGVTDGIVRAPVLRHTQTTSFVYPYSLTKLNVGSVLSTLTLIGLENPPEWAVTGLPTDVPPNFATISAQFGWLKNDPTIQQIANRKVQVITEYEYGLWATAIWGNPL